MKKKLTIITILFSMIALLANAACTSTDSGGSDTKPIMTKKTDDNLTVTLSGNGEKLKTDKQELLLAFTDASGNPAEITAATLNFNMPAMGSMAEMNDPATLTTTDTAGQFKGTVNIRMAGEWIAQITYEGPAGKGRVSFPLTAIN